jgi:hypothetical protein
LSPPRIIFLRRHRDPVRIIDFDFFGTGVLIFGAEDPARELFLKDFFATLGFEALPASCRLGVGAEVLRPGGRDRLRWDR